MKILAFDTATAATTVALLDSGSGEHYEARDDPAPGGRPGHTERLLSLCGTVLDEAGVRWSELDRLCVGVGPGTFTGLRIGIATAHALSQSTVVPLVGVSTLSSLVSGASGEAGTVLAVIDARRGEAFVGSDCTLPAVVGPSQLTDQVRQAHATVCVGDGAIKFRAELEAAGMRVPADDSRLHRVSAVEHCRLAIALTPGQPTDVQPEYLRVPDAELTLRARDGR
jgi:tRNA threonylcarbamoyladenosine biosynthesis protein TsaB